MKHGNIILNIVFGFAIVILFILNASKKNSTPNESDSKPVNIAMKDSAGNIVIKPFPVAYIVLDSLMENYTYYKKLQAQYQSLVKQEDAKLKQQGAAFEQEVYQYQSQKAILTKNEVSYKEQQLQAKQQHLMELQDSKTQELSEKEQALMKELNDSVTQAIKFYNIDNKYEIVLNNVFKGNVLYAKDHLNITDTILKIMNARYTKALGKK